MQTGNGENSKRNLGGEKLLRTTQKHEGKNHWSLDVLSDTEIQDQEHKPRKKENLILKGNNIIHISVLSCQE